MNDKKAKLALAVLVVVMVIFAGIDYARGHMLYPMTVVTLVGCVAACLLLTRKKSA